MAPKSSQSCAFAAMAAGAADKDKDMKQAKKPARDSMRMEDSASEEGSKRSSQERTALSLGTEGWSPQENEKRKNILPHLMVSKRILSKGDNTRFGNFFYEDLFRYAEPLRPLFEGKDLQLIAQAFGKIPLEMLRMIMLPSKASLVSEMYRLALRHVDYGAARNQYNMFEACMLRALNRYIVREGGVWNQNVEGGWRWIMGVVSEMLFANLEVMTPKVTAVRESWQHMISLANQRIGGGGGGGRDNDHSNSAGAHQKANRNFGNAVNNNGNMYNNYQTADEAHTLAVYKIGGDLTKILRRGLPNRNFEWSEEHGRKLGIALELIVSTIIHPQRLEQELWRLAQKHLELGVHAADLDVFEIALFSLLKGRLHDSMYKEVFPSWKWMWDSVKQIFVDVLMKWQAMRQDLTVSWEALLTRAGTSSGVSAHFYGRLFRDAPLLQDIFQRRNETMVDSFAKAFDMIVRCSQDSSLFDKELEELAVRHCKFDLQSWHFEVFGQVLVKSLNEIVGDTWTEGYNTAWKLLYNSISNVFLGVLDTSRNPMCNALVRNSVEGAIKALENAPRNQRAARVLAMKAGKRMLSPILWALRDSLLPLAELFLDDMMTLRSDRSMCYYGVQEMWVRCPHILDSIIEYAPVLLDQFFSGHMWVSKTTIDGHRRVNMWNRFIYGDPLLNPDVFKSPLGVLTAHLPESHFGVFVHPVLVATIDLKWRSFGRSKMLFLCSLQLLCLVLYIVSVTFVELPSIARFGIIVAWLIVTLGVFVRTVISVINQIRSRHYAATVFNIQLPQNLTHFYVQLRLACCVLSFIHIGFGLKSCIEGECQGHGSRGETTVDALLAFTQWIQVSEFFKLNEKLAAVFYLGRAVINDCARFLMVLLVWFLAIGAAIQQLVRTTDAHHVSSGFETAYVLFAEVMQMGDDGELTFYHGPNMVIARLLFVLALWVAIIPILNLMVAAMVSTYSRAEVVTLAIRARAVAVLEAEYELLETARRKYFDRCGFEEMLPFTALDKGPPGGISILKTPQELKEHPSYELREDNILFFSGSVDPNEPWPPHEIPQLHKSGGSQSSTLEREVADLKSLLNTAQQETKDYEMAMKRQAEAEMEAPAARVMAESSTPGHCVLTIEGNIYDVAQFLPMHPGGSQILRNLRGKDATEQFLKHQHLDKVREVLGGLPRVGNIITSNFSMKF